MCEKQMDAQVDSIRLNQLFLKNLTFIDNTIFTTKRILAVRPLESKAIFCRWEELWTKSSKVNVRLRLGNINYVDYLEKKTKY